MEKVLY